MFTFLASLVELLGIVLKSIIKSCVPHHGRPETSRKNKSSSPIQSHHKDTECSSINKRDGTAVPKKPRRASVTERTVSSCERTVVFELEGSSPSSEETKT